MKVIYLTEGAFGSYKNKLSKEDKFNKLKRETNKIIANDIVKQIPDYIQEQLGSKEYMDSLMSKKSVEAYNYNFSQLFLTIRDFLGVEIEGNTIYLKFRTKIFSPLGFTSNGPTGYDIVLYDLNEYNRYLMIEALCKELSEIYGAGINFDFKLLTIKNLNDSINVIQVNNKNKIYNWSLNVIKCVKYPEFLLKHKDVYENRTADEIYLKIFDKLYTNEGESVKSINTAGKETYLSIDNISSYNNENNEAAHYILNLCKNFPNKIRFYIHSRKELDDMIESCESLTGYTLKDMLNNDVSICVMYAATNIINVINANSLLKIVQKLDYISAGHFYVSTKIKDSNRRVLTPCNSTEQAMEVLTEKLEGEVISFIEIGYYTGVVTYDSTFNSMVQRAARKGDNQFYYLHIALK